jgi:16S rRNA G1207 methylase RsmC
MDLRSDDVARSGDRPQQGSAVRVLLDGEGRVPRPKSYDLVVGNPPYYSHFQIADIFLQAAQRALRPGRRVLIITKDHWHGADAAIVTKSSHGKCAVQGCQRHAR